MYPPDVRHRALGALALFCALASCSGGGGGASTLPTTPQSTPSSSVPQPYTLNAITGVSGVASGSATAYASAAVTVSAAASSPTGVAVRRRAVDSQMALLYFGVAANGASAFVTEFKASVTLATAPVGSVSLSQWENGVWAGTGATVTVSGSTVTFDYSINPGAATPVYFALYTGTELPTPSPSPSESPTPSAAASPTSSSSAPATSSPSAAPSPAANSCLQTPQPGTQGGGISNQASSFFTAITSASQVCVSVWEPSSQVQSALVSAATNHAAVTVIYPIEEYGEDKSDANTLAALGATIIWENDDGSSQSVGTDQSLVTATLPIHAKFALVNGVAYMDGHNWFSSDVILQDANAADYAAIQTDLTIFPASPPSVASTAFTTDKYNSLDAEAALISSVNPGSGDTLDFISEDFEDYGAPAVSVYAALTTAVANGATVNVIVEGPSGDFNSYESCDLSTLAHDGAHVYIGSSGSEKIVLIGPTGSAPTSAWIGSSNMSDYDYIDWGMTVTNSSVVSAMQSYYSAALSGAASYTAGTYSPNCSL